MADNGVSNLASMLDVMDQDPNIDCVVLELFPVIRPLSQSPETADPILDLVSDFNGRSEKPFMLIVTAAYSDALASETRDKLVKRGIPSFSNFERAAKTLRKLADYYQFRHEQSWN
jgi:acyl-CoA synthetase (NDP forming)